MNSEGCRLDCVIPVPHSKESCKKVLAGLGDRILLCIHIDDILVFLNSVEEHLLGASTQEYIIDRKERNQMCPSVQMLNFIAVAMFLL